MIYEKVLEYLDECEREKKEPDLDPGAQLRLLRGFRLLVNETSRFRGLQLEKHRWRAGLHKRCSREHNEWRLRKKIPIVCLCGSTQFKEAFERAVFEETLAGRVVLSVGGFTHHDNLIISESQKLALDELHLHKINIADEVLVINQGNYIGESTLREIRHAQRRGKPIRFLFPLSARWAHDLGIPVIGAKP